MMSASTRKAIARLEKIQFDPYNESSVFQKAAEAYYQRNGHYPKRAADQIYRTRKNRDYCKEHGIRMFRLKLGRPSRKASTKEEYQDNTDRLKWNASSAWTSVAVEQADHDQAVGYNTVIDCPVGVCDESIRNLAGNIFALFCRKRKRIRFHPFHRIRSM